MKDYERRETGRRMFLELPIYARIDGRSFSKFTKGMTRPYDQHMSTIMQQVTKYLVEATCAQVGYTQSDEINLCWTEPNTVFFRGKTQKMVSTLAALATSKFTLLALEVWPDLVHATPPTFDCRVFQLPTLKEAVSAFTWRERDATKNAITMAASTVYSHGELLGKTGSEKQEMLHQKGINFNNYPDHFKRGSYFTRQRKLRVLSEAELEKIPEAFRPKGPVERIKIDRLVIPPIDKIRNKSGVLFRGEAAVLFAEGSLPPESEVDLP